MPREGSHGRHRATGDVIGDGVIEVLKRQEVADLFKLPIRTVDYLVATDQIPFSRIGKRAVRFSKQRLEEWFQEREGAPYHIKEGAENDAVVT
jgi:excisionase family DNA binding protein